MKKILLLITLTVNASCYTIAQEKSQTKLIRTEPNGVQVYESIGNESAIGNNNEQIETPIRTLNDWNLEECENALYFIGLKIEQMKENEGNELQIQEYETQKELINEKINSLTSNH